MGWLDRMLALEDLRAASLPQKRANPVRFGRNGEAIAWLAFGAIAETVDALKGLGGQLSAADRADERWVAVERVIDRWEKSGELRPLRDEGGFHIPRAPISAGLEKLAARSIPGTMIHAEGERNIDCRFRLASEALVLHHFEARSPEDIQRAMDGVFADLGTLVDGVQWGVIALLKSHGALPAT